MTDTILKLKILWLMLANAFSTWRSDILPSDLDARFCCNGHECGCQGVTNRDVWAWEQKK